MKILSWNIMSGGFSGYDSQETKSERLDAIVKTIREIDAEVVSLVDTHRWTEIFTNDDLKRLFGYENVFGVKLEDERLIAKGHDNGVTVLTRLPVEKFETVRIFSRNAIKTSVSGVDIFTTYLDDLSEDVRLSQIESLLKLVESDKSTIIMGDLNTIDEVDLDKSKNQIDRVFIEHPDAKPMEAIFKEMMRGEVTKKIKESGLVDLGSGMGNTVPTKLFPIKIGEPVARFDYAFGTKDIKVKSFKVLSGENFGYLSDHYPIMMDVEVDEMTNK